MAKLIACLGDSSTHSGTLITTNQDNRLTCGGIPVCADGCLHACPYHGVSAVSAVTVKSYVNGKLIITYDAVAGCGALIRPPNRRCWVE